MTDIKLLRQGWRGETAIEIEKLRAEVERLRPIESLIAEAAEQ